MLCTYVGLKKELINSMHLYGEFMPWTKVWYQLYNVSKYSYKTDVHEQQLHAEYSTMCSHTGVKKVGQYMWTITTNHVNFALWYVCSYFPVQNNLQVAALKSIEAICMRLSGWLIRVLFLLKLFITLCDLLYKPWWSRQFIKAHYRHIASS